MSFPPSLRAHLERLDHDIVRLIAHRDERYQCAVGADLGIVARLHRAYYGNVSGAGIYHQQMLFVRRQRQRIGMAAYLHSADHAALVNGIDADGVRSEIAHVQQTVVGGDDSTRRVVADQVGATDLVVIRLHDGEIVPLEVADEQLAAVGFQRKLDRQLAHVQKRQQPVGFQVDGGKLVRAGARDERLAVIGKDDDVLRLLANWHSTAHRELGRVKDGDGVVGTIAYDHELPVRRNSPQTRSAAYANGRYHRALGNIDDGNIRRAGVGHVGALAVGRNGNKVRRAMNANGGDHFVALGVNDADVVGFGVDDVDFVALGIGGDAGRACADGDGLHILELQQIDNADGIALAVGNVRVFVVPRLDGPALATECQAQRQHQTQQRDNVPESCFGHQRAAADPAPARSGLGRRAPGLATGSAIVRFNTFAISRTSAMRLSNCSGYSDCLPSLSARSGSGWTSMMRPSAPTATAARDSGVTLLRLPVPWLGSTMIGRWLSRCTAGTTLRSSVLRVWSANVRTPRSHRTTL